MRLAAYLGALLAECAIGRAQADAAAVRLAKLYAADPLLQLMPVPRFRLPSVTMEVPIAIVAASNGHAELSASSHAVLQNLRTTLSTQGMRVEEDEWSQLSDDIRKAAAELADGFTTAPTATRIEYLGSEGWDLAQRIVNTQPATSPIRQSKATSTIDEVANAIKNIALSTDLTTEMFEKGIEVELSSARLQELSANSLLRLTLSATENGVEWALAGDDKPARLRPE